MENVNESCTVNSFSIPGDKRGSNELDKLHNRVQIVDKMDGTKDSCQ